MIIVTDLDEVIGTYEQSLREFVKKVNNIPEDKVEELLPVPIDFEFSTWEYVKDDFKKVHAAAVADGLYRDMGTYKGASETLWKLNDEGHWIRVITSRFVKHGQNHKVVSHTAEWLDKKDIPYRDLLFLQNKVDAYADVYIEDAPHNIHALTKAGRNVIVFHHEYNKNIETKMRAYNWDDVYNFIQTLSKDS